jgi:hypothetical protein
VQHETTTDKPNVNATDQPTPPSADTTTGQQPTTLTKRYNQSLGLPHRQVNRVLIQPLFMLLT